MTPEIAYKLTNVLGADINFWLGLEAGYRADLIKVKKDLELENDFSYLEDIDYELLVKEGLVEKTNDKKKQVTNLCKYLGIAELSLLEDENLKEILNLKISR